MRILMLILVVVIGLFAVSAEADTVSCTEIESVPITLNESGVYCFKKHLRYEGKGSAITIEASNVTIDMNHFMLHRAAISGKSSGIISIDNSNITIRNGTIFRFATGIRIVGNQLSIGHLIEDVNIQYSQSAGIVILGREIVIRNNRITNTGSKYGTALSVINSTNVQISGNFIGRTVSTNNALGILIHASRNLEILNNSVLATLGSGRAEGIRFNLSSSVALINNRVLNIAPGSGLRGISAYFASGYINCIDNMVSGFVTSITGCTYVSGNHTP